MSDKHTDLFRRNGIISEDGKVAGVLSPPKRPATLQAELKPLISEAQRRHVMLRLGITQPDDLPSDVLVFALDVGGPHDTHAFLRRLATILDRNGVHSLDYDIDANRVFELATDLQRADMKSI